MSELTPIPSSPAPSGGRSSQLPSRQDSAPAPSAGTTASLLARARDGDEEARGTLFARMLPRLRRWAHGRLPLRARDVIDTDDLVQVTLLRALKHVERFEPRHEGAFLAYLRRILLNHIRDEMRRWKRAPGRSDLDEAVPDRAPSPVEEAIGQDALERYERALSELAPDQREAVILRVELGYTYEELAEALGRSTPNAARLVVVRALIRLAEGMRDGR